MERAMKKIHAYKQQLKRASWAPKAAQMMEEEDDKEEEIFFFVLMLWETITMLAKNKGNKY